MHFYRKCWFDLFKEQFISLLNFGENYFVQLRWNWFSVWLPVTNATNCHSLYTAFSSIVGAWGMEGCWTKSQDVRFGEQPTCITCPFDIFGYVLELFLMSKIVWNTCKCSTSKTDTIVICRYLYRCNCKFSTSRWRSNEGLIAFQPNFALSISSQGIQFEFEKGHITIQIADIYNCQSENLMTIFQIDLQNHYANWNQTLTEIQRNGLLRAKRV